MTGCLMKNMSPFYTEGDKLDSATLRLSPQMVKIISSYPPRRNLINPVYLLNPSSVVRFTRFEVEDIPEATCFLPEPGTPEIGTNGKKKKGRHIKKGSKAFTILAPCQQTNEDPKETNPK